MTAFAKQLAALDDQIASTEAAAQTLASRRKASHANVQTLLADDREAEARDEQRRGHQLDSDLAFEEARLAGLRARRSALAYEAEKAQISAQWDVAAAAAERRLKAATAVQKAIDDLGRAYGMLDATDREFRDALPIKGKPDASDLRHGIDYSLIAAGIRWQIPNASDAILDGNDVLSRIKRSNLAFLALRDKAA